MLRKDDQIVAHNLRPLLGVLCRSNKEEAAEPLSIRDSSAVLWYPRVQPDRQILPELGHLQGAGSRTQPRRRYCRGRDCRSRSIADTYNDPLSSSNVPWALPRWRAGAGSRTWRSPLATLTRRRESNFTRSWTSPSRPQVHRGVLQAAVHPQFRRRRCSERHCSHVLAGALRSTCRKNCSTPQPLYRDRARPANLLMQAGPRYVKVEARTQQSN